MVRVVVYVLVKYAVWANVMKSVTGPLTVRVTVDVVPLKTVV
jgi:hypothetical protein